MAEQFYKRPLIKLSIELPLLARSSIAQAIADAGWSHGLVSMKIAPRLVEVELRAKSDEAPAVAAALVKAALDSCSPEDGADRG